MFFFAFLIRSFPFLLIVLLLSSCPSSPVEDHREGKALYATYCALCHGETGEGYKADGANALANGHFLAVASDAFLRAGIKEGRAGTVMSAWGKDYGGPLDDEQVEKIVALIRSWQTLPTQDIESYQAQGEARRGALLYEFQCASCHGATGEGAAYMSLNHPSFLREASDGFLRYSIEHGRPPTPMPAYGQTLTSQGIDDLVVLLRSWQRDAPKPDPLPPRILEPLILHPDGQPPDLPTEGRFVSVDALHQAMQDQRAMILIDARPPGDYIRDHIAGAISIPFYEINQHLNTLPKDRWIIAYCACPHAESGVIYNALKQAGFPYLKTLEEGYNLWKERGYPIKSGGSP